MNIFKQIEIIKDSSVILDLRHLSLHREGISNGLSVYHYCHPIPSFALGDLVSYNQSGELVKRDHINSGIIGFVKSIAYNGLDIEHINSTVEVSWGN